MRTLYIRMVITYILIALMSSILALVGVNVYYQSNLQVYNEQKIVNIAKEIRTLYLKSHTLEMDTYFTHIANLGFQMFVVNDQLEGKFYGDPFKQTEIDPDIIHRVVDGEVYRPKIFFVTGLFENTVKHSIGIPFETNNQQYALFIRPNMEQQFGEVRTITGLLILLTFLFSILFILVFTRHIVKPVEELTEATKKIVEGDYNINLDVGRRDEIGNLAVHFSKMAHALEKLDDMRQEFVANVSHEIRSPMTSIQGFAQALRTEEISPEERDRYLSIIEEESRLLSSLSQQLLTLAFLDKEKETLHKSTYRLDEQIRHVLLLLEWQWQNKGIEIDLDFPEISITADKQLLHQVWLNLITNSIKFSNTGGILYIKITINHEIIVTIKDTGIGIPAEKIPYIFDRFYKADQGRKRTDSGSGLGLSIVKKIIQLHQGTIEVSSHLGEGTTFIVRLPHL